MLVTFFLYRGSGDRDLVKGFGIEKGVLGPLIHVYSMFVLHGVCTQLFFICDITHFMFVMYNICAHHIFYMTRRSCTVHALLSQLSYNDC